MIIISLNKFTMSNYIGGCKQQTEMMMYHVYGNLPQPKRFDGLAVWRFRCDSLQILNTNICSKKMCVQKHWPTLMDSIKGPKWHQMKLNQFDKQNWCAQQQFFPLTRCHTFSQFIGNIFIIFAVFFPFSVKAYSADRVLVWINESIRIFIELAWK